ncbi:MAG: thiamine-phosphate kinase [Bacillota bacterium]
MKLSEIGEFGLIERLSANIGYGTGVVKGIGDDAAVLDFGERWLLFTTDGLVEGVHFRLGQCPPEDIGYKALAVSVSDIAAMGGTPVYAVVTIGLPDDFFVEDTLLLYRGMKEAAQEFGVSLVGGDTISSPVLLINVALLGEALPGRTRYRNGAQPGDIICLTGSLGGAAAGLYLLENNDVECPEPLRNFLIGKHRRPKPRVEAGLILASISQVHSLIDISDGLASDVKHIARESGVRCDIFKAAVPVDPATEFLGRRTGTEPIEWALYGGEDYELLFTTAPGAMGDVFAALSEAGAACRPVGKVSAGAGVRLITPDGVESEFEKMGYEHFSGG